MGGGIHGLGGMMGGIKPKMEEKKEELDPDVQNVLGMFGFGGPAKSPKKQVDLSYNAADELGVKVNKILLSHSLPPRAQLPNNDFFGHLISFNSLVFIIALYLGVLFLLNFVELFKW